MDTEPKAMVDSLDAIRNRLDVMDIPQEVNGQKKVEIMKRRRLKPIVKFTIAMLLAIAAFGINASGTQDIIDAEVAYAHIMEVTR